MVITRGIHVDELRKADPVTALKVTVLQAERSFVDEATHWACSQVVRAMQSATEEMEVAEIALPAFKIMENVSNEPNHRLFAPGDQFPLVWERLQGADVVLVASGEHGGYPCSSVVTLIRRLKEKAAEIMKDNESARLFKRALLGVVVVGDSRASAVADMLGCTFNRMGLTLLGDGIVAWDRSHGVPYKSQVLADKLDRLAREASDLCKALCR